jgi:glycosyltransferase involved in cell wall biosynthesis
MSRTNKSFSVMAIGLRGIPNVQGGIQSHCQRLYPRLISKDVDVEVIVRTPYMKGYPSNCWEGIRLRRLWAPRLKSLEAIAHSVIGVLVAAVVRPDILHVHGIGPGLVIPFARIMGLRVVITHHGPDYDRQKWGKIARWSLRLGEYMGMKFSHGRIVISEVIQELVCKKYGLTSELIPNGVELPELLETTRAPEKFDLVPGRYFLMVGRLVPEKRQLDVIEAYANCGVRDWKLVLVGESNHPDQYTKKVVALARATPGVVCTGFQAGTDLAELYSHAGAFILASSHEGHSVALLEALSYGLPVVLSDIPANVEIGLPSDSYYPVGDVGALTRQLERLRMAQGLLSEDRNKRRAWIIEKYNWREIAARTLSVFESVARQHAVTNRRLGAKI